MHRMRRGSIAHLWLAFWFYALTVSAQSGDGGAANGFDNSNLSDSGNGADGASHSSANLSKGAIIAIAVVVAVVVIGGVTLAILFYFAKKRQWQVRQTIRRTTTRVVRAMTPRTATFGKGVLSPKLNQQGHTFAHKNKDMTSNGRHGDVEKGFKAQDGEIARPSEESDESKPKQKQAMHTRNGSEVDKNKRLPKPKPTIDVPRSHFDIDESPMKSPMWQRLFGRK
ncbi:hypothetical protein LTS08_003930 [Lithohypha guttulata]|nr:hypothetical protein LTS08_003930 [Lithohypha guttulata]